MATQNENTAFIRKGRRRSEAPAAETAKPFVEYAFLAAVVYDATSESDRLEKEEDIDFLNRLGWQQWKEKPSIPEPDDWRFELGGLHYEVWEKAEGNNVTAAIAFRGTDDAVDWWTNFRWVTRYVPFIRDQYMQVQNQMPQLIKLLLERHQKRELNIITSGHSLGGGLAHQAAYTCDCIKKVFAFDPSPVTGFYSVPNPPRNRNAQNIVVNRIYEKGEALSPIRHIVRQVNPLDEKDPEIIEIRFNLSSGENAVSEHAMRPLARNLRKKASEIG